MKIIFTFIALIALTFSPIAIIAHSSDNSIPAFSNTIILVIRHAEKPGSGTGLSSAGDKRAEEYVNYFENYTVNNEPIHIDELYTTKDSKNSFRPRLTITPLSQALNLPINTKYNNNEFKDLAKLLESNAAGKTILICWHHGQIPDLLKALGANPEELLPDGKWPSQEYGFVIQLCYNKHGTLKPELTMRIEENL